MGGDKACRDSHSFTFIMKPSSGSPERADHLSVVRSLGGSLGRSVMAVRTRMGFYRQEVNRTVWEVPERYRDLKQVGTGAYGTVW